MFVGGEEDETPDQARSLQWPMGFHRDEAERVEAEISAVCGIVNAATARLVDLIAEALSDDLWVQPGVLSPEHWVAWKCGVSPGRARHLVLLAKRMVELPQVAGLFRAGALSADQTVAVARHVPAEKDTEVAELAPQCTVSQLQRVLSKYAFHAPPEPGEPAEPPVEEVRECWFGDTDGRWVLPVDEGALVAAALRACREDLYRAAETVEDRRAVSWADALVAMAERSQAAGATERPHADRFRMHLHLETSPHGDLAAQIHLGPRLPATLRRYLGCDALITPVSEHLGVPVSVGRTQRIVPDRTRRLIEHRDGTCRVPGCERTRGLHVHHIEHWEDGGTTDTTNLCCLCPKHHRLHHLGHLGIHGDADTPGGLTFTDRWGRDIPNAAPPTPPGDPPDQAARQRDIPTNPYPNPTGERLNPHDVYLGLPVPSEPTKAEDD